MSDLQIASSDALVEVPVRGRVPAHRASLWCGLVIIACGLAAVAWPVRPTVTTEFGYLLLAAGLFEALAGMADRGRNVIRRVVDTLLGLISMTAAAILLLPGDENAWFFMATIAVWLLIRGAIDVMTSVLMPTLYLGAGRAVRAAVDIGLGLISLIGVVTISWLEPLLGWTPMSVGATLFFAAASLVATGTYLIGASTRFGSGESPEPSP